MTSNTDNLTPKAQIEVESVYMPFPLHHEGGARVGRPNPRLRISMSG